MAHFGATIETVERIARHPNADALELAFMTGLGFQCVVRKDSFKVGQQVIYLPVDSVLTPELLEVTGLTGKLNGKAHNRLSISKQLRGEYAVGLMLDPAPVWKALRPDKPVPDFNPAVWNKIVLGGGKDTNGELIDTTVLNINLGVLKYEIPVENTCHGETAGALPSHLSKYDIEGVDRETHALGILMDVPVVIMEKVEGQNAAFSYTASNDTFYVCSRSMHKRRPTDEMMVAGQVDTFWQSALRYDLEAKLKAYATMMGLNDITLYAEQVGPGIQKNIYKFPHHMLKFFDMKIDGRWMSWIAAKEILIGALGLGEHIVPTLAEGKTLREILNDTGPWVWDDRSAVIDRYATGKSAYADILREGIVIKPLIEQNVYHFGRLILKKRSLKYLQETGN